MKKEKEIWIGAHAGGEIASFAIARLTLSHLERIALARLTVNCFHQRHGTYGSFNVRGGSDIYFFEDLPEEHQGSGVAWFLKEPFDPLDFCGLQVRTEGEGFSVGPDGVHMTAWHKWSDESLNSYGLCDLLIPLISPLKLVGRTIVIGQGAI